MIKNLLLIFTLLINPTFCQQKEVVIRGHSKLPMKTAVSKASNSDEPIIIEDSGVYCLFQDFLK